MVKMYVTILLTVLLTVFSFSYTEAAVTVSSGDVLNDSQLEIIVNNQKVTYFAVPYNNTLYIDRTLFSSVSMPGEEVFYISGQNYTCVPLFSTLDSCGVLYDYKKVYDKTIIVIITDPSLAQQYTASTVNVTVVEDNDVDYPWGLGLAVANTVHYLTDDDWYYIYRHDCFPDRFVWVGQNGGFIKGDNGFILNDDNRFFVKGDDGFININKDGINNGNVYYNHNGDNFGVFGNNGNNININTGNINIDKNNFGDRVEIKQKIRRF